MQQSKNLSQSEQSYSHIKGYSDIQLQKIKDSKKNIKDADKKRVGYYCWAGPDMIKMTNLKFFNPKINEQSLLQSYDYDYLKQVKEKLGVTDVWATYSWGFDEKSEQQQYNFLNSKLDNFKKLGLKVHAYIQGPNVVYDDYKNHNWYAKDEYNRLVPYYRGRKVTCLNNTQFVDYISNKILKTYNKGFDGIFVDNIHMGQIPFPDLDNKGLFTFAGCNCDICNAKYHKIYGAKIPKKFDKNNYNEYQDFRIKSTNDFVKILSDITRKGKMEFGSNSYDPKYDTKKIFGTDLEQLQKLQDYILFENHSLPGKNKNNKYINDLIIKDDIKKPVFVVTYDKGIGYDKQYTQDQIDNIKSEHENYLFSACIKGSEFITDKTWHNLFIDKIKNPIIKPLNQNKVKHKSAKVVKIALKTPGLKRVIKKYYNPAFTKVMESKTARKSMGLFIKAV